MPAVKNPGPPSEIPPLPRDRVRVHDVAVSDPVGGETVLLHFPSGQYFGLNAVAASALAHLRATGSVAATLALLLEEYEVAPDRLRSDLDELVRALAQAGLLEYQDP